MPTDKAPKKLPAAEFLTRIQETVAHFADLTDEQRQDYVNEHMKRAGYKPTVSWGDADDSDNGNKSSGGWFPG
jgi:hypothetical protein